jgi:replication factor C large subunit
MENNYQNWTEKYRPIKFSEVKGQDNLVEELKSFFSKFPKGKKAILLQGPAGTGKTTLAHVISNEFDFEIFELNASDFRNKEQLEAKLKPASEQQSLFKKSKILLVDEVDGLSVTKDKGGIPELTALIETTKFPMIITANDIWDKKFATLRQKCKSLNLAELSYKTISLVLQEIVKKENLDIDNQILVSIAIRARGDIRAAINDLQTIASDSSKTKNYLSLDERNQSTDIFDAMKVVFKNMLNKETLNVYDSIDLPLEKIFLWIEENIPNEYSGEELFKAYEALSIADVFRGRIRRQRHWRFLVYQNIFLSAGISIAKKAPKTGFTHYQKPTRILKIWMSNNKNKHKKTIVAKYADKIHCSKRKANKEFNMVIPILKKPEVQKELKLSNQEIDWIKVQ